MIHPNRRRPSPSSPARIAAPAFGRGSVRGLSLLIAALLLTGCSSTLLQDPDAETRRQIADLQSRLIELQKKSVVAEVEILRLREKVAELEAQDRQLAQRPGPSTTPPVRPDPPTAQPVTTAPLPPPIETTDLEAPEVFDASPSESPPTPTLEEPESDDSESQLAPSPSTDAAEPVGSSTPLPMAAQALYDRGFTEYHEGRYLEAETSLQQFLEGFPDSEWSDNALYWIGEARYARRDYRGALAAFRELTNRYPLGNKVPDALLKGAQSLEQLGDQASARQSYREIMRRFPDTATALIAQERLQQLQP